MEQRAALIAKVVALAPDGDPRMWADFARAYFATVDDVDLAERSADELATAAVEHWAMARHRAPGEPLVSVRTPTHGHTVVDVVVDDMPFLVDSITMAFERHDLGVHLVVHPILAVRRDASGALETVGGSATTSLPSGMLPESWTHVEVDRESNATVLDALRADLARVLHDVRAATNDWIAMVDAAHRIADELDSAPPPIDPDELTEGRALLRWLADQHFTFLGYRAYDLTPAGELCPVEGSGLGVLRDAPVRTSASFASLPQTIRAKASERTLLVLTKANARATVHRRTHLDYVGVKRFDARGDVVGEHRFLGLYTSVAYNASPAEIPVLRRKVAAVMARAGLLPGSHDYKDLQQILETYPRDDLFQIDVDNLYRIASGILHLQERRRVRLFVNREPYGRFVSCLVFLPRDRYTTEVRERVAAILTDAYGAHEYEWNTRLSSSILARLHYVLPVDPASTLAPQERALEAAVAGATRSWTDDLRTAFVDSHGEEEGLGLFRQWRGAFPRAYQDDFPATEALADLMPLTHLDDRSPIAARLTKAGPHLDLKLYGLRDEPSLSDLLPRLRNMGVTVDDEHPYAVSPAGMQPRWLKWFRLRANDGGAVDPNAYQLFEDAFLAVVDGRADDDGFNRLVLGAGLAWNEAALLRTYCRYFRQTGTLYSQAYMEDALARHPEIARRLVELFVARLDPDARREAEAVDPGDDAAAAIRAALETVASLDEDRILRTLLHLVLATLRTNWFQDGSGTPECAALKLDPGRIPDLPLPRPMFEVFVSSPRVEGVHLRSGKVARGGIRWSERREDYRTEILGLMKAQRVKNAVIVPAGAKGGFVVKQPPDDPGALRAEIEQCYRTFISALLDITDNLVDGVVVAPPDVVRYDGDDPYLVVAADKGTATFSDIANEIACRRGFWLGDAFASGGEHGYDHKAMGITARGAWESTRRHFRHLDLDPDRHDFTVVGIGDMSGDVFGNGMLLSQHIKLVAAFDHRHVFLDPDPDPERSWHERRRMFDLPASSWADYDASLISSGGGVYARTAKAVPISAEVRAALALAADVTSLTPTELIRAVLRGPVDLLYNGGIGTYVKARTESNADVGDKANDAVRIDGRELRCRCVVEGGNLGFTQSGRVEYALAGGRINTDAIDNSAGVDTSDHEVNIKILLDAVVRAGEMSVVDRNALLAPMTDEVAALVLRDNYRQNRALDGARMQAVEMEEVHARYIHTLEQSGSLDRDVERLPSDDTLAERRNAGLGLTVPELAVLLAYAKITVEEELLASQLPDDPDFLPELVRYFPNVLRGRFLEGIRTHPLRREITATALVNGVVNRAGLTFVFRLAEETGASAPDIVRAHEAARAIYDQDALWREIESLDGLVGVDAQTRMYLASRRLAERGARWLLRNRPRPLPVAATVGYFAVPVARITTAIVASDRVQRGAATFAAQGVPVELARKIAALDLLPRALDVAELATEHHVDVETVDALYDIAGERLGLDWLEQRIVDLPRAERWDALARNALREDAAAQHRRVVEAAIDARSFDAWAARNATTLARVVALLDELRQHGVFDVATLSVALRELRALA